MSKLYALYHAGRRVVAGRPNHSARTIPAETRIDFAQPSGSAVYFGEGVLCEALR